MDIIKVSARSRTTAVAGAIAAVIRQTRHAEVQAIGASAVNQAVKAVAIARSYLADDGIDVICIPAFTEVELEGEIRTAIKLTVEPRYPEEYYPEEYSKEKYPSERYSAEEYSSEPYPSERA